MTSFLSHIAKYYVDNCFDELSGYCFVFPNRRPGIFFKKYLKEATDRTLLAPEITTIADFFAGLSPLAEEETVGLTLRLYRAYCKLAKADGLEPQSYDDFLYFAQVLLSDFNDVDNYLVDAKQIFTNTTDLRELDNTDYLTEEQKRVLHSLFSFSEGRSDGTRAKFAKMWQMLYPLYSKLREELLAEGLCYPGMRNRAVVEQNEIDVPYPKVIFIGFNAISVAERELFKKLKHKADFFWDYDSAFVNDKSNMASFFIEKNLSNFPQRIEIKEDSTPFQLPEIEAWSVTSDSGQCDVAGRLISAMPSAPDTNTAVVLSDEALLLPMLYRIPANCQRVNITMTYPVKHTPIPQFIENYLLLCNSYVEKNGYYYKYAFALLRHNYIAADVEGGTSNIIERLTKENHIRLTPKELECDSELAREVFEPCTDPAENLSKLLAAIAEKEYVNEIEKEILLECSFAIRRLAELLQKWDVQTSTATLLHTINGILDSKGVAFQGEPLAGLQLMGMLETRCLDFENIIITSFNEGIFPKADTAVSFIPYNLRRAFGLPSTEHQDAIYAYHFYRLIHRAKKIWLIYNSRGDGSRSGEESRYIKQLKYLYNADIQANYASYGAANVANKLMPVSKTGKTAEILQQFCSDSPDVVPQKTLSASALNDYLSCQLKFYYGYVLGLHESEEITDLMESDKFGTIFHDVMVRIYKPYMDREISAAEIAAIRKDAIGIEKLISASFTDNYFNHKETELTGFNYYAARLVKKFVLKCLAEDEKLAPFVPFKTEAKYYAPIEFEAGRYVNFKGFVDRIDKTTDGGIRISDYKTGKDSIDFRANTLFTDSNAKAIRQLLLYRMLYLYNNPSHNSEIALHVYALRKMFEGSDTKVKADDSTYEIFKEGLLDTLSEIFDLNTPFEPDESSCKFCKFISICKC